MAIGHARYSTTGSTVLAQRPADRRSTAGGRTIALGHNGNLTNTDRAARRAARAAACGCSSTSDTEVIAALIAHHPSGDLGEAVADTHGSGSRAPSPPSS